MKRCLNHWKHCLCKKKPFNTYFTDKYVENKVKRRSLNNWMKRIKEKKLNTKCSQFIKTRLTKKFYLWKK